MAGNRVLYGDDRTYPKGLTDIPLASYFKITRYQYNEGLKAARESGQNDAQTGLGNIGGVTDVVRKGNESEGVRNCTGLRTLIHDMLRRRDGGHLRRMGRAEHPAPRT